MRIAVFSDVHANLPALEAVLADIDARRPEMVFCLGDLVGYAPWPNDVVGLVRDLRIATIAGNYDEGVGRASDDCGCAYRTEEDRERGARSIAFTNGVVTDDVRRYLRELPRHIRIDLGGGGEDDAMLMVHGSPRRINEYLFDDRPDASFERMMSDAGAGIMLFGHTHKPFHRRIVTGRAGSTRTLHAINTGSVGKPKDGDPRACYLLLEIDHGASVLSSEFVRVPYDVDRAARAVEESGLPVAFATMLREAR